MVVVAPPATGRPEHQAHQAREQAEGRSSAAVHPRRVIAVLAHSSQTNGSASAIPAIVR